MAFYWNHGSLFFKITKKKYMKRPSTNINVTFYLKRTSKNSDRRGIYANITFRSKQTQIATKIFANHPEHFQRGGLVGYEYHEQNIKLIEMKKKLEGYDGHLFNDIDQVLDYYYGGDILSYPSTILEAFKYSIKNSDVTERTTSVSQHSINSFERFILSNPNKYSNFSIIRNAPRQMFRTHAIEYVNYLKDKGLQLSSINSYVNKCGTLFNLFAKNHADQIPDLIHNPFKDVVKLQSKNERKKKALARSINWSYIKKMEQLKYEESKDKMYHLIALVQAHTGLSFIDFGKEDCLDISQTIHGPALIGTRQKGNKRYGDYVIFLTKEVEECVKELKPLLFKPFVINGDYKKQNKNYHYHPYNKFLKNRLAKEIEFEDDKTLTSHRLRHTFGMHCMNDLKMQVHIVAKMMGDDIKTILNNYADLNTENVLLEQKVMLEKMSVAV